MAKVLVVEDESIVAKGLATIVRSIDDTLEVNITGYAEEALKYANMEYYDMFLLDIQLKDYSGLELAKEIRNIDIYKMTPIIFITAIPTNEIMAFKEIHCYDYIIKPFREEQVRTALETVINYGIKNEDKKEYLRLDQGRYSYSIDQNEIIYVESKSRKLIITTINEAFKISTYTLYKLLDELSESFIQCHKSYIINMNYIEKIDTVDNLVTLKDIETSIPIGRKYKDSLRGKTQCQ
ncbi:transcriptional regulator, LytTR family [Gottschalkia acidurici 9a]|uniref:Transcriptional regulator, LytTR family n=1 Tax=Gottschalkia acidurici (strain ATCC 7906 / DSM 604 / BCRC 14475 / CIP 104303 / KCTC 5404 / NCIMB 10678 / 9a) TaxID=1128398 RepID=K0AZE2_GOTA9|nr:LytTR family DNA-binding domain-containing protein [Gottschalkia acidurici]AFS77741.1 transcriptional regulator, LytTR family [Gottschalkia acidurici 9a]